MIKPSRVFLVLFSLVVIPAATYGQYIPRGMYMDPAQQDNDRDRDRGPAKTNGVPWQVLKPGDAPLRNLVVVYWFPATAEEMRRGELVDSQMLKVFSQRCVGMQLVPPSDAAVIAKWGVTGKLPVALLTSADKVVARTESDHGILHSSDVENMVHHELYLRSVALDGQLANAKRKAIDGDHSGAISAYESVWEQHCLEPEQGREAQNALRKLGVTVKDEHLRTAERSRR